MMISNSNNLALRGEDSSPSSSTDSEFNEFLMYRLNRDAEDNGGNQGWL